MDARTVVASAIVGALSIVIALGNAIDVAAETSSSVTRRCSDPSRIASSLDGWERIEAPAFSSGPQEITAYAVDVHDGRFLVVTNGATIVRSVDGGLCWEEVFNLGSSGDVIASQGSISALEVSASGLGHGSIYALVAGWGGGPRVFASHDRGTRWEPSSLGLAPVGTPIELVATESPTDVLYLLVDVRSVASIIYKSTDAGARWATLANATDAGTDFLNRIAKPFSDIAVDPLDANALWATSDTGLYRSQDGGATWRATAVRSPVDALDVSRAPGHPARITAFSSSSSGRSSHWSSDGGQTWSEIDTPDFYVVESVAHYQKDIVISLDTFYAGVYSRSPPGRWKWLTYVTSLARPPFRDISVSRAPTPYIYGHTPDAVMRRPWAAPLSPPPGIPDPTDRDFPGRYYCSPLTLRDNAPPRPRRSATLGPDRLRLVLSPGQTKSIRYELALPAAPIIDLFFLIDASPSMEPALCGAAHGAFRIATVLAERGFDANFGVGTYQDHESEGASCYAYRRDRDIGPLDLSFAEALFRVRTCGENEPQMTALYQVATGEGQLPWIPPGQDASFREEATPVVVHISDEALQEGSLGGYLDQAVAALKDRGIRQVGLDPGSALGKATGWLRDVALQTDAVAAPPGVDCDMDGSIDIPPSAPLVCSTHVARGTEGPSIANAIINMVLALRDDAPVRLIEMGRSKVVDTIDPDAYPRVNLRANQFLVFDVTYACQPEDAGKTIPVDLAAEVRSVSVARVSAVVICSAPALLSSQELRTDIPPAPLPPAAVHAPQPRPNPQTQPRIETQIQQQIQQQATAQSQAMVVPQRQTQPQMALVRAAQQMRQPLASENAMVSARRQKDLPEELGYGVATGLASLLIISYGYVLASARSLRTITITRRRR